MHRLLQSAGFLLLSATALPAQQNPTDFESWNPPSASLPQGPGALRLMSVQVPRRDYRYEGLALGGIAFGALGAWVGSQITEACPTEPGIDCGPDRLGNALAVGIAAAAVGGGLGYLVGRLSSKPDPAPAGGAGP
jgi:hypothetical protein